MNRLTPEEKYQVVKRYLNERVSYRELGEEIGVDESSLRYWVKLYDYHGENAFDFPYTKYSPAFKLKVIQFIEESNYSIREASALFHIPDFSMVRRWKKKWETGDNGALESIGKGPVEMSPKKKNDQNNEIDAMKEELEYLRMENAYLKKLNALVQEKEQPPRKKKRK